MARLKGHLTHSHEVGERRSESDPQQKKLAETAQQELMESARKVWLAGLGALTVAGDEGARTFSRLVERGRKVEERSKKTPNQGESFAELAVAFAPDPQRARAHSWDTSDPAQRLSTLIETMTPETVPTPAMVLQARRNSAARAALIEEFGLLTGGQIAEINESAAENRAALASRWKQERKIFSVTHYGATYYPAFQFASGGRPRPVVARVLEALGGDDGWETALWFTAANGYLEAARPVDLLETDPEAVVEAARKDVEVPY